MIKKNEISDPNSCFNKAADDEPLFVLRANDPLAPAAVAAWAGLAFDTELHDRTKVTGARRIAEEMRRWRLTQ